MENKFFLHRCRKDGDSYISGIEVHDTVETAIQSFHGQMKMGYDNPLYPNITYISCMVTNENDNVIPGYNETCDKDKLNNFYVHYIRHDGDNYTKGIEVHSDFSAACRSFHTHMEYGYDNSKFPNITFVACKITSSNTIIKDEVWVKEEPEE